MGRGRIKCTEGQGWRDCKERLLESRNMGDSCGNLKQWKLPVISECGPREHFS